MKVVVYGLGIIGASIAAALRAAGHTVLGKNRRKEIVEYALEKGLIDGAAETYEGADIVFLALPPYPTMKELDEGVFPDGCIVADVCGVKQEIECIVLTKQRNYRYVGTHPMAGKETSGILSADKSLFQGANLVLTYNETTDEAALETIRSLGKDAGFSRVVTCTAREHDEKIAVTSQLAHIVSNAYMRAPSAVDCSGYTGGSFQDMTRVAGVDERLWAELYLLNREALLNETESLIARLKEYADILRDGDWEQMEELLKVGKAAYSKFYGV